MLKDSDIDILRGRADHWDIHDDVVYNAIKHEINRKSDLLNYLVYSDYSIFLVIFFMYLGFLGKAKMMV